MTLGKLALQKAADWKPGGSEPGVFAVSDPMSGWAVLLHVERHDAIGSLFRAIELRHDTARNVLLADWSAKVAASSPGLGEPLQVIEVDTARGESVIRSAPTNGSHGRVSYFEVRLGNKLNLALRRYCVTSGASRESVPFALTHEAATRLIDGWLAAAA